QHLCAMTRASEGRFVNLKVGDEADDFYRRVAFAASQVAPILVDDGTLKGPFDREIVKQPGMSYFYGSRAGGSAKDKKGKWHAYGMTKQVIDVLEERGESTKRA